MLFVDILKLIRESLRGCRFITPISEFIPSRVLKIFQMVIHMTIIKNTVFFSYFCVKKNFLY